MTTDTRKSAILAALWAFLNQRPGMEPGNYGSWSDYRREYREVLRDKHDAERLLRELELRDNITADDILREAGSGGRLTIETEPVWNKGTPMPKDYTCGCGVYVHPENRKIDSFHIADCQYARPHAAVSYCTGQYFATEYRKAVARLAAAVLWAHAREYEMPLPFHRVVWADGTRLYTMPAADSPAYVAKLAGKNGRGEMRSIEVTYGLLSAGDWLRAHFKREFGRHLAERYFT